MFNLASTVLLPLFSYPILLYENYGMLPNLNLYPSLNPICIDISNSKGTIVKSVVLTIFPALFFFLAPCNCKKKFCLIVILSKSTWSNRSRYFDVSTTNPGVYN